MIILNSLDASLFEVECFGVYEEFFPDYLVDLLHGGLRLGARLVFVVIIFDG